MPPRQAIVEGQTATNPRTGERIVYRQGRWYPLNAPGQPATANNPDTPMAPLTPGSENRARIALGYGPALSGERQMEGVERQQGGRNPLNTDWGATLAEAIPFDHNAIARAIGGDDYQSYRQGSASFEAAILPVLSGAAVTPSEAQRQIRANLPQFNDSPATLARKAHNRQLMLNAAADLVGRPRPFPQAGTWDFQSGGAPPQQRPRSPAQNGRGLRGMSDDEIRRRAGL